MLPTAKYYLKFYSMVVIGAVAVRMFFKKKTTPLDVAALVPTFIFVCNL